MSVTELKENLILKISKLENVEVLEDLQRLLEFDLEDSIYILNDKQIEDVSLAENQIADGKVITNEDVVNEIDKWLTR